MKSILSIFAIKGSLTNDTETFGSMKPYVKFTLDK